MGHSSDLFLYYLRSNQGSLRFVKLARGQLPHSHAKRKKSLFGRHQHLLLKEENISNRSEGDTEHVELPSNQYVPNQVELLMASDHYVTTTTC